MTTAHITSAPITPAPLSDPTRKSSVTDSIDRLQSVTAVTGGQEDAMTGLGRAVADELSAAAAKLSTTAPEATAPSQLSSASTAASLPGTLSVVPAAAAQPTPAWPVDGASDPTGTALGGALQIVNTFVIPNSDYDAALSQQVGFFVYNGGIIFFPGFVTTLGNVTTNAGVTWASWRITKRCMSGRAGSSARFSGQLRRLVGRRRHRRDGGLID